jgi:hypothetical protein
MAAATTTRNAIATPWPRTAADPTTDQPIDAEHHLIDVGILIFSPLLD